MKKNNLIIFSITLLIVFGFFGEVKAGAADNVSGWAWSENIGWISFNCANPELPEPRCTNNYGVNINTTTGVFSGYSWSENIGWISFNEADLTGCPRGTCQARLDFGTKQVSGWAKILSNNSWISLSTTTDAYGVSWNNTTQEMEGWAWSDTDVGWISFNCKNTGICATSNYKVIATIDTSPPSCDIKLYQQGTTNLITRVNIGQAFDIYVGGSSDIGSGIALTTFASDDSQDGTPQGTWTVWYDWNTSAGDWSATTKRMAWSFATAGAKEVWAKLKDGLGLTSQCPANITVNSPPVSTIYRWDGATYVDDPGDSWQKANFTRYIYDYDSDGSLALCEFYTYDNVAGVTTASGSRTPCVNGAFNSKMVTVGSAKNCPSQGKNACTLGVRSKDNDGVFSEYDTATYHIDWATPTVSIISPTTAQGGIPQTFSATTSDNLEVGYCWLFVKKPDETNYTNRGSMAISPFPCENGAICAATSSYTPPSGGTYGMYARCCDHWESQINNYLNCTSGQSVNVEVTANNPPVITAGPSYTTSPCAQPTTQSDCLVNFSVTATDTDPGDTLTYSWLIKKGVTIIATYDVREPSHHFDTDGTYSVTVTVSDGRGGQAIGGLTLTVTNPTLWVDLIANPNSGVAPLNDVDLAATVSGTMSGTINYEFYCQNGQSWMCKKDGAGAATYSLSQCIADTGVGELCDYPTVGNYLAKVFIERGDGAGGVECTGAETLCQIRKTSISVTATECTPGQTKTCVSAQGCTHTITCQANGSWPSCPTDECTPGSTQVCDTTGTQTCTSACTWGSCVLPDACPPPAPSCPICQQPVCSAGIWTCQPDSPGTDCGDCRQCDGAGSCEYICPEICVADICTTCEAYYDGGCGYGSCGLYEIPVWSYSQGSCQYSCQYEPECVPITPPPCQKAAPTVLISPDRQTGLPGQQLNYQTSITNNHQGCDPAVFSLTKPCPTGWSCSFDTTSLTISSSRSATTTFWVTSTSTASAGDYEIIAIATTTGSELIGSDSAIYTVVIPNDPPTASTACHPQGCGQPSGACAGYTKTNFCLKNNSTDPQGQADIQKSTWTIKKDGIIVWENECSSANPPILCNWTLPATFGRGNYTAYLKVIDQANASNTTSKDFTILQDALAGFMCSLTNEEGSWQSCDTIVVHEGVRVYFKDDPSLLVEYSSPSNGAVINNRVWIFKDGTPPSVSGVAQTNPSATFQIVDSFSGKVTLTITDSANRTATEEHQLLITLPLPEWQEIPPF